MSDQFVVDLQSDEKSVLGPFNSLVRFSGFHIGTNRSSKCTFSSIFSIVIFLFVTAVFAVKTIVLLMFSPTKPLSLEWAYSNFQLGLCLYGTFSAISIAYWTRSDFFAIFQNQLTNIGKLRLMPNHELDNYSTAYRMCGPMFLVMIPLWTAFSFSDFLYNVHKINNTDEIVVNYTVTPRNFFGTQPFIYIWMGVASSLATLIFAMVQIIFKAELNYFNEELQRASRAQELLDCNTLATFGSRHIKLMILIKHAHSHLGVLMTFGSIGLLIMLVFSLFINMTGRMEATIPYFALTNVINLYIFMICGFTNRISTEVQKAVQKTARILLADESLQGMESPKLQQTYRLFMDRIQNVSKMAFLNLVPIGEQFASVALIMMPIVATVLSWYQRYLLPL